MCIIDRAVADKLGIRLHTANFAAEYWDNVFEHFLSEYKAGRTPNPDILCNREIKFKAFLEYALALGADKIATGHYAQTKIINGKAALLRGLDNNKDQSYFLHAVGHEQFEKTLFPVGEMEKPVVRQVAEKYQLATAKKKDSTGICFIGERRFSDFLKQYLPAQPGKILTQNGDVLGDHQGLMYYTIGQRQGLGIGGTKYGEAPWFVAHKDLVNNQLIVVQGTDNPALFTKSLKVNEIYWVDEHGPEMPVRVTCKHRYRQPDQDCLLSRNDDGSTLVEFDKPQRAITPGQSAVFYSQEICLGGGVIEQTWN
jgi:tRNA-specific 2-thiouridylase